MAFLQLKMKKEEKNTEGSGKAVFVGIVRQNEDERRVGEYLDELEFLAETAEIGRAHV